MAFAGLLLSDAGDAFALRSPFEGEVSRAVGRYSLASARQAGSHARILGGIVPHHDLALPMIVRFYERLTSESRQAGVKRVWLFAPDHFGRVGNLAAICDADWDLSFGTVRYDEEAGSALGTLGIVETNAGIFAREHGVTLHIPLIGRYFPNASVVPVLLNPSISDVGLIIMRNRILELFREGDILILSMDLSHYKTPEEMAAEDARTLEILTELRFTKTSGLDVDARRAAALALMLFKKLDSWEGSVLEHMDSSDILGRRIKSGTSYATVMYCGTQAGTQLYPMRNNQ
jgi:AmmeMemoRadiSam system protein B